MDIPQLKRFRVETKLTTNMEIYRRYNFEIQSTTSYVKGRSGEGRQGSKKNGKFWRFFCGKFCY